MLDSNKIRTGKIDDNEWIKLANASGRLAEAPIYIDDTPVSYTHLKCETWRNKFST